MKIDHKMLSATHVHVSLCLKKNGCLYIDGLVQDQCLRNYIGTSAFADVSCSMADVGAKLFV